MGWSDAARSRREVIAGALRGTVYTAPMVLSSTVPRAVSAISPAGADLALAIAVTNATPVVGDRVTITITVTNNGPGAATNVAAANTLPGGLVFVSAVASQGTYDPATGTWLVGALAALTGTATLQIIVTVNGPATDTATITHSDQPDPNLANNTASVTITPRAQSADLGLAKAVDKPAPNVGDTVIFTLTLTNGGPNAATGVQVTDQLPAGLTFASASASQGTYTAATGVWSVGALAAAAGATLKINATVANTGAKINTATITRSDQADPNPANNTASASVTPIAADLAVTKSVDNPNPFIEGDTITFTVTVTNLGPNAATGVVVNDLLPPSPSFFVPTVTAPPGTSYNSTSGDWTIGALGVGVSKTLTASGITLGAAGVPVTNTATVKHSDQPDPVSSNNAASATFTPRTLP